MPSLEKLGLSNNQLTGELPDCWWDMQALQLMDLSNNSFIGEIPTAPTSFSCYLLSLHLAGNGFTGVFPSIVRGCNELVILNLGNHRSNDFSDKIPLELSLLSQLQFLDLSNNSLTGLIPSAFGIFLTSMKHPKNVSTPESLGLTWKGHALTSRNMFDYLNRIDIIWKGQELSFQIMIEPIGMKLMTGIDLSSNSLSQCIPEASTNLQGLRFLNLSRNHLSRGIPENIGSLKYLECLDLSQNELSGTIPPGLSDLQSLGKLDLSNNHLSGKIPTVNQLQTLTDLSIYSNNSGLCGFPLDIPCTHASLASAERNGRDYEDQWLYYCVIAGIVFGNLALVRGALFRCKL
ncbi:hypothetical protein BAE44_0010965 [Dichanthelium oligosanthes]|uniref:Uncharacterized protein n=1 Tax=Dichanthelium oligosanthes TaxID=888268 RepID=A0A1E5VSC6_9POAL|nr:hypothetical protein BAE44_0010965 [Dichanthelium oligosanthes]